MSARSLPDYRWPPAWTSRWLAPWRALSAGVFHIGRMAGWVASMARPGPARVAVLRTDGVGDAILFEPALSSLARHCDGHELHLWAPAPTCRLFEAHPDIHRCVVVPRGFKAGNHAVFWSLLWRARLGFHLGRNVYQLVVYPAADPEPLGNWIFVSMRALHKWLADGTTLNQFDFQRDSTAKHATRLLKIPREQHELHRNARLAAQWGSAIDDQSPHLPLSARALTYAGVLIGRARHAARRARAQGLVGIIPAGSSRLNRYPPELWASTISLLWERHGYLCALLGGPADQAELNQIQGLIANLPHHRFPCDHDIAVSAAVVSRLDGMISVDTGLAHAGISFDVPTVVLATGGMPGRFFPWPRGHRTTTLTRPVPCAGCNYRCTQETPVCITGIEPEQIVRALAGLVDEWADAERAHVEAVAETADAEAADAEAALTETADAKTALDKSEDTKTAARAVRKEYRYAG